jgi:Chitobiase/beta-hexosaminidase C-terminal domain
MDDKPSPNVINNSSNSSTANLAGGFRRVSSSAFTPDTTPTVTASPSVTGAIYNKAQSVELTSNEPAIIYYTIDGSTTTISSSSNKYTGAIAIRNEGTTTRVFWDTAGNQETVQTELYTVDTTPPNPPAINTPGPIIIIIKESNTGLQGSPVLSYRPYVLHN